MLSQGDSVRAKWADEWCLGRFWSEVSETRGCYEILWDNGEQNAIPAADVQRFEQRFKCRHAHHPDVRAAPSWRRCAAWAKWRLASRNLASTCLTSAWSAPTFSPYSEWRLASRAATVLRMPASACSF